MCFCAGPWARGTAVADRRTAQARRGWPVAPDGARLREGDTGAVQQPCTTSAPDRAGNSGESRGRGPDPKRPSHGRSRRSATQVAANDRSFPS
jgi:hypothetical protein